MYLVLRKPDGTQISVYIQGPLSAAEARALQQVIADELGAELLERLDFHVVG